MPDGIRGGKDTFLDLATIYKQLNAPLGSVGMNSLMFANRSIISDDTTYSQYLATLGAITSSRDTLATQIKTMLDDAAFADKRIDDKQQDSLTRQARTIIERVEDLAGSEHHHDDDDHDHDHDH
jgi:hypothetical protein